MSMTGAQVADELMKWVAKLDKRGGELRESDCKWERDKAEDILGDAAQLDMAAMILREYPKEAATDDILGA